MTASLTFLPGTMCDWRIWAPVWAELDGVETGYIALERERTRQRMRALIAAAGDSDGPLNLIGFSMGGYFALEYALDNPDRVASLVLVSASAFGLTPAELATRRRSVADLETHDYAGISPGRLAQFIHPSRQSDPAVADVMRAMDHDLGKDVLLAQLKETSERISLGPRLGELQMPVLLAGADGDNFAPWLVIERMRELIPSVHAVMALDCGHMIPLEQPAWLAAQIARFYGF
jgi:pimeloyl-ACP methyl ester carboxylesterase